MRELLASVPATVKSDPPTGASLVGELGDESGMTPLHFASYSGNENVVRLLLNSIGVQVDAATSENVSHLPFSIIRQLLVRDKNVHENLEVLQVVWSFLTCVT